MIPVDIDNFIVTAIINYNYVRKGCIFISGTTFLIPKELSNCTMLTHICLNNEKIVDITSLAKCKSLVRIYLRNNMIVDISPLSKCSSLKDLHICNNEITDISCLVNCASLSQLHITDNKIHKKPVFNSRVETYYSRSMKIPISNL